ncbi:MAG: DUF7343 domain-containing protein [Candidatus Hadarchaeum sp.]|uniref:DUF7343 domain-containing protein n=1 Tax=Candidatus Hadarchaeum sp. TaxID=2883567 RepID=UPI003D1227E5
MYKKVVFLVFAGMLLFGFCSPAAAQENFARVHGTVYYWYNLEPLKNSIVEVNSVPEQTYVAKNGEYFFNLPPGTYKITARFYRDNVLLYYAEENLTIPEYGGDYVVDLIAFPLFDDFEAPEENIVPIVEAPENENALVVLVVVAVAVLVLVLAFLYLRMVRQRKVVKTEPVQAPVKLIGLPADLQEIIDRIREAGGRITQLELRGKLPYSEAKVSLMLADLESRGLIRRIKKGRGNIIILKEQP